MAKPTGEDLCVGTTAGNTLPEWGDTPSWEEREITFVTPVELTNGIQYAIVASAVIDGDAEILWSTRIDNPTANADLYKSTNSGESWVIQVDDDSWFKTKANGVEKDTGIFDPDGFNRATQFYGARWKAQTFTASSTYTISSVILKLAKYTTWDGTPGIITVSIKATEGPPGVPTIVSPTPTGVTDITLDETPLEWAAGDPAGDTYEIYWRIKDDPDWVLVGAAQEGVEWTIEFGTLAYGTTYEWKIDATNVYGTTEGATWSFTTIDYDQIRISYRLLPAPGRGVGYGPYDGAPGPGVEGVDWAWTGENNMLAVRRLVVAVEDKIWYEDL